MKRDYEILKILLARKEPITTKELGNLMNVSDRTIRSDLSGIKEVIGKHNLKLIKKTGIGIWIEGSNKAKQQLLFDWDNNPKINENFLSPKDRQKFILLKLLLGKSRFYLEYFTSELYVSKSTIEKDLQVISEKLRQFNLKLENHGNGGLYISGDEISIRNAIANLITDEKESVGNITALDNIEKMLDVDIHQIKKILVNAEEKFNIRFSYFNFNNIAIHIAITLKRVIEGKAISFPNNLIDNLNKNSIDRELAIYIADSIKKRMHITMPINETYYLLMHILGSQIEPKKIISEDDEKKENSILAEKISEEFITMVSKITGLELYDDKNLQEGLKIHLMPVIHRIQYDLNLYNPLLADIKTEYSYAYELSWLINALFEKYLGKSVGEDEIAFIALHLAVAIEKDRKKINIAVVCSTGVGISRLIKTRLEKRFPQLNIKNIALNVPSKQLEEEVDLIISTFKLETNKPYVKVSPLLNEEDIKKIDIMLTRLKQKPVHNLFNFDLVLFQAGGKDKKEYLKEMVSSLERYGHVKPEFYESVILREELSSTEIGKKVALTHGFPEHVNKAQICISILEEPTIWDELPVQLVVMIAMNKEDANTHAYNLDWLYKCLDNQSVIDEIIRCKKINEVIDILFREYEKLT
jgi:activator of the mannose operon, transcriptional antiterminator